jgi:apolipoprotein N-acyltransferase
MAEQDSRITAMSDRWSYLWLATGALLMVFSNWRWLIPLATWLFPVFLLRFLRAQNLAPGFIIGALTCIVAGIVMMWGAFTLESLSALRFAYGAGYGAMVFLPFIADRLIAPRLKGFVSTLVFPLAWTTMQYFNSLSPNATWGALAYTQYSNLPLMQIVSITGIWGLAFLITWFASVANWAWELRFTWPKVRRGVGLYAGILVLVLMFGGARLTFFPAESNTVCVASITKPHGHGLSSFIELDQERAYVCARTWEEQDYFIESSRKAARYGARLVFWQEYAVLLLEEDEAGFIEQGRKLARQEEIYLVMALVTFPANYPEKPWKNKLIWIDPSGKVMREYVKSKPSVLEPIEPGDGKVPTLNTPYGKIASVICCDATYPGLIRQAHMNTLRAIENGFSLIQSTGEGLSVAVDHQGMVLSALDYWRTEQKIMISHVPTTGVSTIYSRIGDLFAWLCFLGLISVVVWDTIRHKTA